MEEASDATKNAEFFEVEMSYEKGEAGFKNCFVMCNKNPNHEGFIPSTDFNIDHLPPGYRDPIVVEVIAALAKLTLRVSVTQISSNRPAVFTDNSEIRQVSPDRERTPIVAAGTGRVFCVDISTESKKQNCPCDTCKISANPRTEWGVIHIQTANHVVYDNLEAEHTICHLFDDGIDENGVVMLQGMKISRSSITDDICNMTYTTHDMDIVYKMHGLVQQFLHAHCKVHTRYMDNWYDKNRLTGNTAATSPRLSVLVSCSQDSTKHVNLEFQGAQSSHEQKQVTLPLNQLNLQQFPPHYQDDNIIKMIHSLSDITVQISVSKLSKNRPPYYPGTDDPFPFHDRKSQTGDVTTGSGTLIRVCRFTRDMGIRCECNECLLSPSPQEEWGLLMIVTSKDAVFDDSEAENATCHFLVDNCQEDTKLALSGKDIHVCSAHAETNSCVLLYATHNMDIVQKTYDLRLEYLTHYRILNMKYNDNQHMGLRAPGTRDISHKLAAIVSHPHGLKKRVSVGEWVSRRITGVRNEVDLTEYTYTTHTCRGSSGASIFTFGRLLYSSHHPHSRGQFGNINTSAAVGDVV